MSRCNHDVFGDVDSSYPFDFELETPEAWRSRRKNKKRKRRHRRQLHKRKKATRRTKKNRPFCVLSSLRQTTTDTAAKQRNSQKSDKFDTSDDVISLGENTKHAIVLKVVSGTSYEHSSKTIDSIASVTKKNKRGTVSVPDKNRHTLCDLFARLRKERAASRRVPRKIVIPKHVCRPHFKCLVPCYEFNIRDCL